MLSPKRVKYRKKHRTVLGKGDAKRGNTIAFGEYGLVSAEHKLITNRQIEAARIAMTRHIKRGGKVWIRIFPDYPYTKKPAETRMGKGKGDVDYWFAEVKAGTVLYEIAGVSETLAKQAFRLQAYKLPVKTCMVKRRHSV